MCQAGAIVVHSQRHCPAFSRLRDLCNSQFASPMLQRRAVSRYSGTKHAPARESIRFAGDIFVPLPTPNRCPLCAGRVGWVCDSQDYALNQPDFDGSPFCGVLVAAGGVRVRPTGVCGYAERVAARLGDGVAARAEISPQFRYEPRGGRGGEGGAMIITADEREGLDGAWVRRFEVKEGGWYRFQAWFKGSRVPVPRRSIVAKVDWQDGAGKPVAADEPVVTGYPEGSPGDGGDGVPGDGLRPGPDGWTEVSGVYRAPVRREAGAGGAAFAAGAGRGSGVERGVAQRDERAAGPNGAPRPRRIFVRRAGSPRARVARSFAP